MLMISSQPPAIIGVVKNGLSSTPITEQDCYKNSSQLLKISDNICVSTIAQEEKLSKQVEKNYEWTTKKQD